MVTVKRIPPYRITINPYAEDAVSWEVHRVRDGLRLSGATVGRGGSQSRAFDQWYDAQMDAIEADSSEEVNFKDLHHKITCRRTIEVLVECARKDAETYVDRMIQYGDLYGYPAEQ